MKKSLLVVLALLLGVAGYAGYGVYENKKAEAAYTDIEFQIAKADFAGFTKQMREATGQQGSDRLKKLAESFPHTDTGIAYDGLVARAEGDDAVYAPRVRFVWAGSAAQKVGIEPGDWVTAIDGASVEIRCAKGAEGCPSVEVVSKVQSLANAAEKKTSLFTVVRGATTKKAPPITPVPYGQDIRDHILANLDGYRKQLEGVAPKIAALDEKVAKAADMKTLKSLVPEANSLAAEINEVYQSVEAYIKTRIVLPAEPTKAEPQL